MYDLHTYWRKRPRSCSTARTSAVQANWDVSLHTHDSKSSTKCAIRCAGPFTSAIELEIAKLDKKKKALLEIDAEQKVEDNENNEGGGEKKKESKIKMKKKNQNSKHQPQKVRGCTHNTLYYLYLPNSGFHHYQFHR